MDEADASIQRRLAELEDVALDVQSSVRWGNTTTEIIKEATNTSSDVVLLEASQPGLIHTVLAGDPQRELLTACPTSVFVARPGMNAGKSIVVLLGSAQTFPLIINRVRDLQLPRETAIYLACFIEPISPVPGMLFSLREYYRKRDEARNDAVREIADVLMRDQARHLTEAGSRTEVIVRDQRPLQGLIQLIDEVSAGLVIVSDTALPSPVYQSTQRVAEIAQHVPCSVLVVR